MATGNGRRIKKTAATPRVTPKRGWPKGKPRGPRNIVTGTASELIEEGDPVTIDNEGYVKTAKVKTEQEKDRGNPIFGTIVFNNSQADKDDRTISRRLTDIEQTITNLRSSVERVERTVNRVIDRIG